MQQETIIRQQDSLIKSKVGGSQESFISRTPSHFDQHPRHMENFNEEHGAVAQPGLVRNFQELIARSEHFTGNNAGPMLQPSELSKQSSRTMGGSEPNPFHLD